MLVNVECWLDLNVNMSSSIEIMKLLFFEQMAINIASNLMFILLGHPQWLIVSIYHNQISTFANRALKVGQSDFLCNCLYKRTFHLVWGNNWKSHYCISIVQSTVTHVTLTRWPTTLCVRAKKEDSFSFIEEQTCAMSWMLGKFRQVLILMKIFSPADALLVKFHQHGATRFAALRAYKSLNAVQLWCGTFLPRAQYVSRAL